MEKVTIDCRTHGHPHSRRGSFRGAVFAVVGRLDVDDRVEIMGAVDADGVEIGRYTERVRTYAHDYSREYGPKFVVRSRFGRLIVERVA